MHLTILGNNSALPNHNRFPTAQVLSISNELFLIDCGEGTQVRLQKHGIKTGKITRIFISHLHGDHYFGLIGLLTRYGLNQRTEPLELYGPSRLEDIIRLQLDVANTVLPYTIRFVPVSTRQEITLIDEPFIKVTAFPTDHRIECYGFRFEERDPYRHLDMEAIQKAGIPVSHYKSIKEGRDYNSNGTVIPNSLLTRAPKAPLSYAYCADTRFTESFLSSISGVDLLYHETTYMQDHEALAAMRYHSTTHQAGNIALKANAKQLVIGHFSSKYADTTGFLDETRTIFPNTLLSSEGMVIEIE